jgi:hypothetical protein
VVNKTPYTIDISKDANKITLEGNTSGLFYSPKNKICVRMVGNFYGEPSAWSKKFAINTVGVTGVLELDNTNACRENEEAPA